MKAKMFDVHDDYSVGLMVLRTVKGPAEEVSGWLVRLLADLPDAVLVGREEVEGGLSIAQVLLKLGGGPFEVPACYQPKPYQHRTA